MVVVKKKVFQFGEEKAGCHGNGPLFFYIGFFYSPVVSPINMGRPFFNNISFFAR